MLRRHSTSVCACGVLIRRAARVRTFFPLPCLAVSSSPSISSPGDGSGRTALPSDVVDASEEDEPLEREREVLRSVTPASAMAANVMQVALSVHVIGLLALEKAVLPCVWSGV